MEERRRFPRRGVEGHMATVPWRLDVRVLDISVAGMLLHAADALEPGTKGQLRLSLEGSPFTADVEVLRVAPDADGGRGYRLGTTFVGLSEDLRQVIERFMTR
jgi:hypothetical protein